MTTSEFRVQTLTPYFLWLLPNPLYREKKRKKKREKLTGRERKKNRIQPNPATVIRSNLPFRSGLVSIESPWAAGHLHVVLAAGKRPESHRSKPWEAVEMLPQLATDLARWQSSISIFSAHGEREEKRRLDWYWSLEKPRKLARRQSSINIEACLLHG